MHCGRGGRQKVLYSNSLTKQNKKQKRIARTFKEVSVIYEKVKEKEFCSPRGL